jgi:hypothetical protein
MAAQVISDTSLEFLLSIEYDGTALAWCRVYDNPILGWIVDDTGAVAAKPVIVGQLPTVAAAHPPIVSPQWTKIVGGDSVLVPDLWRGSLPAFFTWLATNNGANRKVGSRLTTDAALNAWTIWARDNPTRADLT